MGNTQHSKVQEEKKIIANPQEGRASDFYWACHNGDIELVKSMVPHIPYAELNQLEPNGSTPLHAASFYCHTEVVHFLLHECGVRRHRLNRYGLTAFEEAQTDEIKELYRRKSNRFNDEKENVSDIFEVLSVESGELNSDDIESSDEDDSSDHTTAVPSKWIQPYRTTDEIEEEKYYYRKGKALIQSKIGRFIMRNGPKYCAHCRRNKDVMSEFISYFNDRTFRVNKLREIVDEVVNPEDCAYNKCHQLLDEYLDDGNVESLLTLYTFQTGFYEKVKTCCQAVSWSLYIILPDLKDRFYCGKTYRGVMMTEKDLDAYRSAIKHPDSLVKTKTLSSSSIDRFEAEKFLVDPTADFLRVLMVFHFPDVSDMAINLDIIEEKQLPSLSEYPDEKEVLILPQTFFRVQRIEFNSEKDQYEIHLENMVLQKTSLISAMKFMIYRSEEPKLISYYTQNKY